MPVSALCLDFCLVCHWVKKCICASLNFSAVIKHSFRIQQLILSLSIGTMKTTQMAGTFLEKVDSITSQSRV